MNSATPRSLDDPAFWHRPLQERMDDIAAMRARSPFVAGAAPNTLTGRDDHYTAVISFAELNDISRRPLDFCSGQGSTSIVDMPAEAVEFFGSFITMDDPRHFRQRSIVARSFTPKALQTVLDSVETICTEVIDDMCEHGEVDLVQALSQPFPLLVICDMMGIPRSEFGTVLDATNVILGAGDPEILNGRDPLNALLEAGMTLTGLMNEIAEERRKNPTDDLTSALVHNTVGEDMLAPEEIAPFFILLAVAGNDTTRTATSYGVHLLTQNPDQRAIWKADLDGVTPTAVEEIVRVASPVTFMRRTSTRPQSVSGHEFAEGDRVILLYGAANRDPLVFPEPDRFDVTRNPNPHVGFGGPGPHFCLGAHLARRELSVVFRQLLTRLPDIQAIDEPEFLEAAGMPLVSGIKRMRVRFTPTARSRS